MANTPSTAEVLEKEARKRATKPGDTVRVRALETGQYGHPLPAVINKGNEFDIRISDLEAQTKKFPPPAKKGDNPPKHYDGSEVRYVKFKGALYALPKWLTDAKVKVEVEDENFVKVDSDESEM